MSAPAVLISSARLRPGEGNAFAAWQARHNTVLGRFPGFISSDIIPPAQPEGNEWTIVLNFRSQDELTAWQRSSQRVEIVGEALPLFEGGNLGEVAQPDRSGELPGSNVTEVILSKIKSGMDDMYRAWAVKIQAAQAKYPGYRGMYLQPPAEKDGFWTTIIRYDTRRASRRLDGGSGTRGTAQGIPGLYRARAAHASGHFVPRLGTNQSSDRKRSSELEDGSPGRSGTISNCYARDALFQSDPCLFRFARFFGHLHQQQH